MTKITQLAAERDLLTRIEVDYSAARYAKDYDEIKASVEELEAFVMHSDFPFIRNRAQKMIDQAFDPMQH